MNDMLLDEPSQKALIEKLLKQPNGTSFVLALVRDGKIDPLIAIRALNQRQEHPIQRLKRSILAVSDCLLA